MAARQWCRICCVLVVALAFSADPAMATVMCYTGASSGASGAATASGSTKILEAASQAMLAYRGFAAGATSAAEHRDKAMQLLDAAITDYRQARSLTEDVTRLDEFLRARPFEQLRVTFGITPGTLNAIRWDAMASTARKSSTPASELIAVCISGAEAVKTTLLSLRPDLPPSQLRRAVTAWLQFVSHGSLVSDAFDASVR